MSVDRQLVWEKWASPLGAGEEVEWPGAFGEQLSPEDESEFKDSYGFNSDDAGSALSMLRGQKMVSTPFGIIPLTEHNDPSKQFNFWTAHTNFEIGKAEANIIQEVPGVEIYDQFSRYRFRISVGKLFDSTEVKYAVQEALGLNRTDFTKYIEYAISEKRNAMADFKYWAMLVLPNGSIVDYTSQENNVEYQDNVAVLELLKEGVGGRLITSVTE